MIDLQKIGEWIGRNIVQIVIILSIFIQISPIKINPWSKIFKWIGKIITEETNKKIENLSKKNDQLESSIENINNKLKEETAIIKKNINENEKDRIRWEVLDFANSCRNGRKHTEEEFKHIISLNDKYKELLRLTGDKNGVFEADYNYVKELYEERLRKNDFLP